MFGLVRVGVFGLVKVEVKDEESQEVIGIPAVALLRVAKQLAVLL